jgi:predicted lipoprotein with Yx(FWY)xxD motif
MFQVRFHHAFPKVGAFFIVLSMALAACMPLQAAAAVAPAPASTGNLIPLTGGGDTATPTSAPAVTATPVADTPAPVAAAPTATQAAPTASVEAPTASAPSAPLTRLPLKTAKNKKLGTLLVDANGMSLYINKQDSRDVSTCTGSCAATWLPALVQGSHPAAGEGVKASLLGMFTRPDGTQQATYKGLPLYHFTGDQNPGDVKGQGIGKEWSVVVLAKPAVHKTSHHSHNGGGSNSSTNSGGNNNNANSGGSRGKQGGSGGGGGGGMGGGMMP